MSPAAARVPPGAAAAAVARERERVADWMHDEVAPLLLAAQLELQVAEERGTAPAGALARARELIGAGEAKIHQIVAAMTDADAAPAGRLDRRIGALLVALEAQFARPLALVVDPAATAVAERLAAVHADLVVTAVREGVVNAVRHAQAERVTVRLRCAGRWHLVAAVEDRGGAPRPADGSRVGSGGGHGLRTLRRRAADHGAHVDLALRPGRGATLTLTVPVVRSLA